MKFLVGQVAIFLEKDCLLTDCYFELEFTIKLFQTNDGHDHSKNYNDNGSKTYLKQSKITIKYYKLQKDSKQKNLYSLMYSLTVITKN